MDQDTGQIYDQAKYAAYQKGQRAAAAQKSAAASGVSAQELLLNLKSRISRWLDMPKNQGRQPQDLLQDPDYLRLTKDLSSNVKGALDKYVAHTAQNRQQYAAAMASRG